jgi:hypothetical protein
MVRQRVRIRFCKQGNLVGNTRERIRMPKGPKEGNDLYKPLSLRRY